MSFKQNGACPKCGAAIYIDADLVTVTPDGEILSALPVQHFTCMCRLTQPVTVPTVIPTYPNYPFTPVVPPFVGDPVWREPRTGDPIPWRSDTYCRRDGSIDWSRFTGSGSLSQAPDPNIIVIL